MDQQEIEAHVRSLLLRVEANHELSIQTSKAVIAIRVDLDRLTEIVAAQEARISEIEQQVAGVKATLGPRSVS